jgi:sec-independent protein translocase protein TatC
MIGSVAYEQRLSLVEHLTELRARILVCLLALVAAGALCLWQNQRVLGLLDQPLAHTMAAGTTDPIMQGARWDRLVAGWLDADAALTRRAAAAVDDPQLRAAMLAHGERAEQIARLAPEVRPRRPVTLGVSEPFLQTLKVSLYAGVLLAFPLILFQIYAYVLPALSPRERELALPAMIAAPVLFAAGVVFAYFTVVPRAVQFLQSFNADAFDVLVQAQPYYGFVLTLMVATGLLFQVPIAIVAATRTGIVTTAQLARNRRYAVLAIAVLAMLLPGQDPVTLALMMAPMYVLFEASLLAGGLLDRRAARVTQ